MRTYVCTWLAVVRGDDILLAMKKRGFGAGYWNGVGGKTEDGETLEHAAVRETIEEIGITPVDIEKVALVEFDEFVKGERARVVMHCFVARGYTGELVETDEMRPQWFAIDNLPFDAMMPDDQHWLPQVLSGQKVRAFFKFDQQFNILHKAVEIVPTL